MKMETRAIVQLVVEVKVPDLWEESSGVDQVYTQAKESAIGRLRRAFASDPNIAIAGEPAAVSVTTRLTRG